MRYISFLTLLFLFGCQDDSRLSEKRETYICKKFDFEIEVSDWVFVRNKMHEIAIKHDRPFIDNSSINAVHPELSLEIPMGYPTSYPPHFSFKLGSLTYLGKKTKATFYLFAANKGACDAEKEIYSDVRDAMKERWEITENLVVEKIKLGGLEKSQ
jgi:hypothetical protein